MALLIANINVGAGLDPARGRTQGPPLRTS